jgi:prepilin-type N-terminal cleavage/methylation domain-containing protein
MAATLRSSPRDVSERGDPGFTLIEALVTVVVLAMVMGALVMIVLDATRSKTSSTNEMEAAQAATAAMEWIVRDLQSAGYEADITYPGTPQPAIAYIDSAQVLICSNQEPYPDSLAGPHGAPQAYAPGGAPRPRPLDGTSWEPPVKYRTGAEIIRYTLDVNNDGQIDATDLAAPLAIDAASTHNPDDYILVREVYGDSAGGAPGDNGGAAERLAPVLRSGDGVPPLFTVYLKSSTTPWDWAAGPIPEDRLSDIDRVLVQVTTASPEPDALHRYAKTTLRTQVQVGRNRPAFLAETYVVDGYVFWDMDRSGTKNGAEPGLPGAGVKLGQTLNTSTNSAGYFLMRVPAGTYTLRHVPLPAFGAWNQPDSFVVTVGPGVTCSFADTATAGGYLVSTAFVDLDSDQTKDAGEVGVEGLQVSVTGGTPAAVTDSNGRARQFVPAGAFTATLYVPGGLTATTPNPYSGTMAIGDSVLVPFALE